MKKVSPFLLIICGVGIILFTLLGTCSPNYPQAVKSALPADGNTAPSALIASAYPKKTQPRVPTLRNTFAQANGHSAKETTLVFGESVKTSTGLLISLSVPKTQGDKTSFRMEVTNVTTHDVIFDPSLYLPNSPTDHLEFTSGSKVQGGLMKPGATIQDRITIFSKKPETVTLALGYDSLYTWDSTEASK